MVWPKVILSSLVVFLAPQFREQAVYTLINETRWLGTGFGEKDVVL